MKVLLVDDEQSIIDIFGAVLKKAGYEVVPSMNGADCLEKAKTLLPDIILLDQILPDMSGNDILKTMKADVVTKNIPIAMLSNYTDDKMMEDAINQGATDYILKYQIDPSDLVMKVEQILKEKPGQPNPVSSLI